MRGSPWKFTSHGQIGHGDFGAVPAHRIEGGRDRVDSLLLRRCVRSRACDVSAQYGLAVSRAARAWARGWCTGLGSESQNLPAFVVMSDGATKSGPQAYSSGFLPAVYQGTVFRGGSVPGVESRHSRRASARRRSAIRSISSTSRTGVTWNRAATIRSLRRASLPTNSRTACRAPRRKRWNRQGVRGDEEAVRHRRQVLRTISAANACSRAGWWSAEFASSNSTRARISARTGTMLTPISRPRIRRCAPRPICRSRDY